MGKLDGKVAFITGAARGMGRTDAVTLAREGADIVICDIDRQIDTVPYEMGTEGGLDETKRLVEAQGRRCLAVTADVRDGQQMKSLADRAVGELGKIDILVANAGIGSISSIAEMDERMWRDMIDVNLTGQFNSMRAVLPHMIERAYGRIVAVASMFALTGAPRFGHYDAAKHGVIGLVKTAAVEVAKQGITVNAVCPTFVDTPMIQNEPTYKSYVPDADHPSEEQAARVMAQKNAIPVPWVEPQDIANAILFLVSDEARYVTGTQLVVDAGATASAVA